jgi:hypothetical protein
MTDDRVAGGVQGTDLDPYSALGPRLVGVVDSNAVLSSVENDCRNGYRSRLLRMTAFGRAILYAADHVYSEVYEHLPTIAKSSPVPLTKLRAHFEEHYLPVLRFVTISATGVVDPQVLAITDPDDVPTGQLAKLVGPCVVFSDDKHLRKPGFAPRDWRKAAKGAVDLTEGIGKQNVAGGLAIAPGRGAVSLSKFLGRQLRMSPWLVGGLAAASVALMLTNPDRRTRFGRVSDQYGVPVLAGLQGLVLPPTNEPSVKQQVAMMLVRSSEPLLAREIQDLIEQYFPADTVPAVTEVRAVLKEDPEFVSRQRYRWEFGRYAAPWRGGATF